MMVSKSIRRKQFLTSEKLRQMGFIPTTIEPVEPTLASILAGIQLSLASALHKHISISRRTKKDVIGNFNCSRPDGSKIVYGCSTKVWEKNFNNAMSKALAYLEMANQ